MRTTSRKRRSPGGIAAVVAAALLVLVVVLFRQQAAGLLSFVTTPILNIRNSWGATEVSQLRAELASTTAALADRDLLAQENAQLRAELGRTAGKHLLLAGIVERPPGTPYDTLLLDAGANLGVAVGMRVSVGGISIGQVDTVNVDTARVTLYSAPGQSYQALLTVAKTTIPVGVEGQGAGSMQARVPAGTTVAVGDSVVFSGVAGGLLAKVAAVSAPAGESFETIYLQLPVNLFELRFVYIEL